jgi:hypothetical protein
MKVFIADGSTSIRERLDSPLSEIPVLKSRPRRRRGGDALIVPANKS